MTMMKRRKNEQHPLRSPSLVSPSSMGMIAMPPRKYRTSMQIPITILKKVDIYRCPNLF